jgi:transketolase
VLFAAHFKLDNLIVVVDKNEFQAMGSTDEVMGLGDIEAKFAVFGFDAVTLDGHNEPALDAGFHALRAKRNGRPKAIVANTVKGKGVSFMEHNNAWHYTRLSPDTYQAALAELETRP